MTVNRKLAFAACLGLPLVAVLVWVILALGWIGVLLSIVGLALAVTLRTLAVKRSPAVVEPEVNVSPLVTAGLPTADDQVFLNLTATIHWTAGSAEPHHVDLAREAILRRARAVTKGWQPAQMSLAQHELAARVAVPEATNALSVWATDVKLELPVAVQQHLAKTGGSTPRWPVVAGRTGERAPNQGLPPQRGTEDSRRGRRVVACPKPRLGREGRGTRRCAHPAVRPSDRTCPFRRCSERSRSNQRHRKPRPDDPAANGRRSRRDPRTHRSGC